ncbi:sialate O-acetylesterase [Sinomicrobium sp.]
MLRKPLFFISVLISTACFAQTKLGALFSDHMVLQRETEVSIWGTDNPDTKISISTEWGEKASAVTDADGKWKLTVKTTDAGDPYTIEIKGSEKIVLSDVLLGEVWLCSGQSNMQMPMKGFNGQPINNSNDIVLNSTNPQLRLFHVKRDMSDNPKENYEGSWKQATPEAVFNFSAVAYMYGSMLQEKLGVPVGIINSSVGGTRVEAWTRNEVLTDPKLGVKVKMGKSEMDKNNASVLYNAMIHPLIPYGIKGVLWYQGESNRGNHEEYKTLFPAMINSWREEWGLGDFPFYYVQIAPYGYKGKINSAYLREAQLHSLQHTTNTGMAVTMDIGSKGSIHPPEKREVAKRLLYLALAKTYGYKGILYNGPVYKAMEVKDNKVHLSFDYAPNGLFNFGKPLSDFTIAGKDRKFHPAEAKITRGKLVVWSKEVPEPVAVRYGWSNYLVGSLFNLAGLPASSFRTDNWEE